MRHPQAVALCASSALLAATYALPAHAAIIGSGDLDPIDLATWSSSSESYIGKTGTGSLTIDDGSDLTSHNTYIGYESGATGLATVGGLAFALWTIEQQLTVGNSGSGTLSVTDGGIVNVYGSTWVAPSPGASGEIHFDGGRLRTYGLFCTPDDLTGTGTINVRGLVSDIDFTYLGYGSTVTVNNLPGQDITIVFDDYSGPIGAGYKGMGSTAVNGGSMKSEGGYIGYLPGSSGTVTVAGPGSIWENDDVLYVGREGDGTLVISNGGKMRTFRGHNNNGSTYIGYASGTTGQVTVDGADSSLYTSYDLFVGREGDGTLTISGGASTYNQRDSVIASGFGTTGEVTVDGIGSNWEIGGDLYVGRQGNGTLAITNDGVVSGEYDKDCYIADESGSTGTVTVDGADSLWTDFGGLYVGRAGNGNLELTGGGAIHSRAGAVLGSETGSTGQATVSGDSSFWHYGEGLTVGHAGDGSLSVKGGAFVRGTETFILGYDAGTTGTAVADGAGTRLWSVCDSPRLPDSGGPGFLRR